MDGQKNARELSEQAEQNQRAEMPRQTFKASKERLYDKIGARLPLKVLDIIIWAVVALILLAVIVGMAVGS